MSRRRWTLCPVAAVLVAASGCQAPARPPIEPTSAPSSVSPIASPAAAGSPGVPGGEALRRALLTAADLGSGFTISDTPLINGDALSGCVALTAEPQHGRTTMVLFSKGVTEFVGETLTVGQVAEAERVLTELASVTAACKHFTGTADGLPVSFAVQTLVVAPKGDRTVALQLTMTTDGLPLRLTEHVVGVRHGDVLILLVHANLDSVDAGFTERMVAAAYDKTATLP